MMMMMCRDLTFIMKIMRMQIDDNEEEYEKYNANIYVTQMLDIFSHVSQTEL